MGWHEAVGLITLIFLSFAFVHSLSAAGFVKALTGRIFGRGFVRAFYRFLYTCFSALTTLGAVYLILGIPDVTLYEAPFLLRLLMHAIQSGGFILGILSLRAVNPFEFMGFSQAWRYIVKGQAGGDAEGMTGEGLIKTGVYGIVRHPLYLAGIIIFSFNPVITRNWLTVSVLSDMYFIFGAFIEQRRLIRRFGNEYRKYMKEVPGFVPRLRKIS
ncbi:MAG: isoprenylcysteine carboxylmethyltransferase family protein [Thermodesulfovibrionales bacterium]|nr:isoprenylcysteine carboxylmethyltransferase family protein [Thermodesulfovibrionales bacterium]